MTTSECSITSGCRFAADPGSRSLVSRILDLLYQWHVRAEQRRELRNLPAHVLKDVGVSWEDAYREYRKPFWRL
jgi:uncharacterized protein YjiS (DUF1127 family)